jgi:uncharacterized paraquat-inducible protein A
VREELAKIRYKYDNEEKDAVAKCPDCHSFLISIIAEDGEKHPKCPKCLKVFVSGDKFLIVPIEFFN